MFTSNRAELTRDLSNRSSCTRVLKQPPGYRFKGYGNLDLLGHVHANSSRYLAAVFAVIRAWFDAGCQSTDEHRHDFRGWCQPLDWIVQNILGAAPLMDGHQETQTRMTSPALNWLRDVAAAVDRANCLDQWMQAHRILGIIVEDPEVSIPGFSDDDVPEDNEAEAKALRAIGKRLKKCFQSEKVTIDAFTIERQEVNDDDYRVRRSYRFSRPTNGGKGEARSSTSDKTPACDTPKTPQPPHKSHSGLSKIASRQVLDENVDDEAYSIVPNVSNAGYAGVCGGEGGDEPDDGEPEEPSERGWV
jgi:hypothetical protein